MTKEEKQDLFLKSFLDANCNVSKACESVNISRTTYYDWVNNSDSFKQKRNDAVESLHDDVENSLLTLIKDGNVTAIIFYCKTKLKKRGYVENAVVDDNEKAEPLTINVNVADKKSDVKVTRGTKT